MYLAIETRSDIAFPVNHLVGFLDCYCFKHWHTAICVLQYLKGTWMLALKLGGMAPISLSGHVNTDFVNKLDKHKSVMGYKFSLSSSVISSASYKQRVITLSSTEAKYIGALEATKEVCCCGCSCAAYLFLSTFPLPSYVMMTQYISSLLTGHSMPAQSTLTTATTTSATASKRRKSSYLTCHPLTTSLIPLQRPSLCPLFSGIT
jgi:hypothetical protein